MERKKILRTQDKKAGAIGVGYNQSVNFTNTNKPLPTGEVIKIVSQAEQFFTERKESTTYRLTATLTPLFYLPQQYYWIGANLSPSNEFAEVQSTSETSVYNTLNYSLPNILTPSFAGGNPTEYNFDLDKTSNWVGHVLYAYENEYLKLYTIPEFTANLMFLPEPNDARYGIDTGINDLIYYDIVSYLDSDLDGLTISEWFNGTDHILEEPQWVDATGAVVPVTDENATELTFPRLIISNQEYKGYTQDGIPFLFSVPVKTEQGWYTALYTPFEHNFEEGDWIFVKPLVTIGYITLNGKYDTCDPTLYGFKRVIGSSWETVGDKHSRNYVIIEHKTKKHWDWVSGGSGTNTAGENYPWTVESSQGFIKKISNYSPELIKEITVEFINITHFTLIPAQPDTILVTLGVLETGLRVDDKVLITISEEGLGTELYKQKRSSLFNLSGIYTVVSIESPFSFTIRAREIQDNIAYFNQTLSQLVLGGTNYYVEVSRIGSTPSEYYLRKGKIITSINNFEINKLPFSNSIYNDPNYNVVIDEDINIDKIKDNYGKPISELFLMLTKRAGQKTYDFTDVECFFSWMFNYSSILVKTGDGLDTVSRRSEDNNLSGHVKNVSGGFMSEYNEYLGDWYYIDFVEYNNTQLIETRIERLKNRFNTIGRECPDNKCDEILIDGSNGVDINIWGVYTSYNAGSLTLTNGGMVTGAELDSSSAGLGSAQPATGNYIYTTVFIPTELCNLPDDGLLLEFQFTQVTSTGVIRILGPSGNEETLGNGLTAMFVGVPADIDGTAQTLHYSLTFNPSTSGMYRILLGIVNFEGSYQANTGNAFSPPYTAYFNNINLMRYYGTPKYGGWVYDPLADYKIKQWSSYIETADPSVLGIPYWAQDVDGLMVWRDLLDVGYFEDVNQTLGVDYPFLNGKHYINIDKTIAVGITPSKLGLNSSTFSTVIYGCMDDTAINYNPFATYPCESNVQQGGPCVEDVDGIMQTGPNGINPNLLGCCCSYLSGTNPTSSGNYGQVFATQLEPLIVTFDATINSGTGMANGPNPEYQKGDQNFGWNAGRGIFPYWKEASYFGTNFSAYDLSNNFGSNPEGPARVRLAGVVCGISNPVFNANRESGFIAYDIFRYENFINTVDFDSYYGSLDPNNTGSSQFGVNKGKTQGLFDNALTPYGVEQQGPSFNWNNTNSNGVTSWTSQITDVNGTTGNPQYFDHNLFEFYTFDTSQCNTCYDKGGPAGNGGSSTNDYLAPRHGWPTMVDQDGNVNNPSGVPTFQQTPPYGGTATQTIGFGIANGRSGIIEDSIHAAVPGGVNIVGHRLQGTPDVWRFFYGQCTQTWKITNFPTNLYNEWPNSNPGCSTCAAGNPYPSPPPYPSESWTNARAGNILGKCDTTSGCESDCGCLNIDGGNRWLEYDAMGTSQPSTAGNQVKNFTQPSYYAPEIPLNMKYTYEFRGRLNIEMGLNYDGYEHWYNSTNIDQGWSVAGSWLGAPPIVWNNPNMNDGSSSWVTGPTVLSLGAAKTLAFNMSQTDAYQKYTRLYSGFWIGIVSEKCGVAGPGTGSDYCTYIYDPDDGTAGGSSNTPPFYQSEGYNSFVNKKWDHGCGGFDINGIPAVNKMAYSPCRDTASGYADCDLSDQDNPNFDPFNHTGFANYLPSCGETNTTSNKSDFQKRWSQSFKSAPIPMHQGDKAFIFIRSVGGTLRDNNVQFDGFGVESSTSGGQQITMLPTYWSARNVDQVTT
tara:strand:- start:29429 stop:34612 length:5184 start_codon:yes stop_codon:yes gene_type:complete